MASETTTLKVMLLKDETLKAKKQQGINSETVKKSNIEQIKVYYQNRLSLKIL